LNSIMSMELFFSQSSTYNIIV